MKIGHPMKHMFALATLLTLSQTGCYGCGENYSSGTRSGTLVKFSKKGLIWKSWEGQINLGGTVATDNGAVANAWDFSVTDPAIATFLEQSVGKTLTIQYRQWAIHPSFVDSPYVATTAVLAAKEEKK